MPVVTISPKFQVVIPRDIREQLELEPGQKVQALAFGNRIEFIPVQPAKALRGFLRGIDTAIDRELARRWDAQRALDEAVAAIRAGDAARAIKLAEGAAGSVLIGLLGVMVGSRNDVLLSYVQRRLAADPALAHERHAGRTICIPMPAGTVRSLNLATAAGIAVYEALRQLNAW